MSLSLVRNLRVHLLDKTESWLGRLVPSSRHTTRRKVHEGLVWCSVVWVADLVDGLVDENGWIYIFIHNHINVL